ncbi:hypothetical protein [Leptolyngbya sp. AN02str]|uniref:hypothetical protein n=1 Tax=Leptolyngbya sp. AN02str TaxID=3423363 RepID=UPI003D31E1EC
MEILQPSTLAQRIDQRWRELARALTVSTERRVWQQRDRHGNPVWLTYDPYSDKYWVFTNETEMRQWIECPTFRQPRSDRSGRH